jgi:hypothetical protein
MAETIAAVPVGSGTLNLDMAQLTAIIAGVATTVSRQIMTIGDPNSQIGLVSVTGATGLLVDDSSNSASAQILGELRAIRYLLQHMADRDVSPDITDTDIN